jgi:imidazolonepropionase-like amidohydrolase
MRASGNSVGAKWNPPSFGALETGTGNAARALYQESLLGTIDVGKRADLILLEANPLERIENVARRAGVLLRGRWLSEAELQRRMREVAQRVARE